VLPRRPAPLGFRCRWWHDLGRDRLRRLFDLWFRRQRCHRLRLCGNLHGNGFRLRDGRRLDLRNGRRLDLRDERRLDLRGCLVRRRDPDGLGSDFGLRFRLDLGFRLDGRELLDGR